MDEWNEDELSDDSPDSRENPPAPLHEPAVEDEDDELPPERPELPLDDQDRILLVLAYLGILALIPYLTARKDFVVWHARQGLLLFGVSLITLFSMILANVILWHFHWVIGLLFLLLLLLFCKRKKIPDSSKVQTRKG